MNRKTKRHHNGDEPIFAIPPYKVERVLLASAETIDWGLKMLSISSLWRLTRGEGIKIAVLDTGVDFAHPDLSGAILEYRDFTDSVYGAFDYHGHGTHVAGIIAAREDSRGVIGVAPKAELLIGKVLGDDGYGFTQDIVDGIQWAVEQKADIINLSFGSSLEETEISKAIEKAVKEGIFVICAAGNSGPNLDSVEYPAKLANTIAVGAIDRRQKVPQFSSRGPQVDIVAPGDDILSTYTQNKFAVLSGTSMAAPFVSGVAALMLAKHRKYPEPKSKTPVESEKPVESQKQLIAHLRKTAIDLGPSGPDPDFGFGLINPEELLSSQVSRVLSLIMEEDLTESGIEKLKQFAGDNLRPTFNNERYFEGNIRDGVGEIRGGIRIEKVEFESNYNK